ncbi:MAG: hypothetical protein HG467_001410 [Clostridiales bacterium]|nr:hypothetical protein [Clostridiales bacterium]
MQVLGFEYKDDYDRNIDKKEVTVEVYSKIKGMKFKIVFLKNKDNKLTSRVKGFDMVIYKEHIN